MKVALASCHPFPEVVVDDEAPLRAALERRGCEVVSPAWDAAETWSDYAAVLIRTTWDYHTRASEFLAWCDRAACATRLFHDARVVRWNADKRYLRDLAERGVAIADTTWLMPGDPPPERLPARGFMKPVVGANAFGTLRFTRDAGHDDAATHEAIAALRAEHPDVGFMLQPYLRSVETEGELSAIVVDGRVSHAVQKVPAAGDYRVQEDWGAKDHAIVLPAADVALAERIVAVANDIVGAWGGEPLLYARVDFLRDDGGALVLNELEAIEPSMFFRRGPDTGERLAEALLKRL